MSFRAKRELLVQVAPRYRAARRGQRSVILDEFVAVTGYDRNYAILLLLGPIQPVQPIRRPRAVHYGAEVQRAGACRSPPRRHNPGIGISPSRRCRSTPPRRCSGRRRFGAPGETVGQPLRSDGRSGLPSLCPRPASRGTAPSVHRAALPASCSSVAAQAGIPSATSTSALTSEPLADASIDASTHRKIAPLDRGSVRLAPHPHPPSIRSSGPSP